MLTTININVSVEAINPINNVVSGNLINYYFNYDDDGNIINNTQPVTTIKPVVSPNNANSGDICPEIDTICTLISIIYPLFNIINCTFTRNFSVSPVTNSRTKGFTPPVYNRNSSSIPYNIIIIIILISRNSSPSIKITIIIIIIIIITTREREIK